MYHKSLITKILNIYKNIKIYLYFAFKVGKK